MKKYFKFIAFAILSFFFTSTTVFAREMTVEDLGNEAIKYKENTQYIYVIGHYAFTSDHNLTQQDIMLAARSIKADANDGYTNDQPLYTKMSIQTITPKYSGFDITGWQTTDNLVGSTKLDTKFDIRYIDYKFYAEISKAELDVTISDTYNENLKTLSFEGGNTQHTQDLELKNGKLTGLVLKHDSMENTVFDGDDKTGYYFAFLVKVPNVKDETTVTLKGAKGTTKAKGTDFDTTGESGALLVLWSVDPKTPKDQRKIVVTVDYDGEGTEYEGTEYTIDYSDLRYQEESKVTVSYEENLISQEDKDTISNWGYTLLGENRHYEIQSNGADNKYKVTGKVEKQTLKAGGWSSTEQKDYFFIFTLKKPDDLEKVPDGVKVTVTGKETTTFDSKFFNENGLYVNLFKLDSNCKSSSNCKIKVKVDWDGDAGKEYLESSEIEIDYSGLTFVKGSDYTVQSLKEATELSQSLKEDFGWEEPTGFDISFSQTGNTVKVTGLLPILDEFADEQHPFGGNAETGYYLPFAIKTSTNKNTEGSNKTTVKVIHEDDVEKTITADSFDGEDVLYLLRHLDPKDTTRTFKIVVDMDGDGEEYSPYTLTFDWSDLKLQEVTKASIEQNNIAQKDKEQFTTWGYNFDANQDMTFDTTGDETKVSGKLVEQKINDAAFGKGKEAGFYFTFTISTPENVDKTKVKVKRMTDGTSESVKKEFPNSDIDENGNLTILYRFDTTQSNCTENCKLYYKVDLDGDEYQYLPKMVVLDYSGLTFEKSSLFSVVAIDESSKSQFTDDAWYAKEGYSVEVKKDGEAENKYKVSGVLPILEDSDWDGNDAPFDEEGGLLYYLGLGLKLENAPEGYNNQVEGQKINIIFEHDAESKEFSKLFGSDFAESQTVYILKALKATDESGAPLKAADKWFKITVDLDGESNDEYAPYEVTIDYSDLEFQTNSLGEIDFDVLDIKTLSEGSQEKKDLDETYKFNADTIKDVEIKEEQAGGEDREASKVGLKGTIRQQTLAEGTFDNDTGYFVPIKISVPQGEEWFQKHKNDWQIILNTESKGKKTYTPTADEYAQGWVLVLFRLDDQKDEIKYEIDFDGKGAAFFPTEYTIKYDELSFKTENTITFEYFDETTGKVETVDKAVYEGDPIPASIAPQFDDKNYSYHDFDYWYEKDKGTGSQFDFGSTTTEADQDLTLKAHWTIDVDSFLVDVVKDLASVESEITKDYTDIFQVTKTENTITFKVLNSATKLSELSDTSIPGAIAYILQRGEIKDITLASGGKKVVFTKEGYDGGIQTASLDETGSALKDKVKSGAKALFVDVLGSEENEQNMTLNQMAVLDNEFTLTIGSLDDSVKLTDGAEKTYTFDFETEVAPVKTEAELTAALANPKITHIDVVGDFEVKSTATISRKIAINSDEHKTITAQDGTDAIFNITTVGVTMDGVKLSAKTPIKVSATGGLTATNLSITGDKTEAGVVVANGGTFTGSKITYDGEKYSKPLVKAENPGNGVNLTNKKDKKASAVTMQEVKRYVVPSDYTYKNSIGDELKTKEGYDYKNYYNDPDVENNFIRISYSGDRVTTSYPIQFTRWYDKEEGKTIEPDDNIKYLTTYDDSMATYSIEAWIQGGGGTRYEKGSVPKPTTDTYYGADLAASYHDEVTVVSDKETLKTEVSSSGTHNVIIVDGTIELDEDLNIEKNSLTIIGVKEKGTKEYATIKGKINVKVSDVHLEKINIVGKSTTANENSSVITVSDTGFSTYQANVSAEALTDDKNWHSLIEFTHQNPSTVIYFGNFEGKNSVMMIDFKNKIGKDSIIVGNNFNGAEETKEFINIAAIDDGAEIDVRQQTATFVGTNEYGIRIKAPQEKTTATISLGSFWENSLNKVLKIGIDVTDESYDVSGFTFKAGEVFKEKIKIYYIKDGEEATETNPKGESYNAKLEFIPNPLLQK